MAIRVGINGFGRIGRMVFRVMCQRKGKFDVKVINDLADPETLAHLLKYDSVHGQFSGTVKAGKNSLTVNGKRIQVISEKDPGKLPWKKNKVYFAVESTGVFRYKEDLKKHLKAGAEKVLLTVPPKDEIDATIVLGVNDEKLKPTDKIISNASCTTNCLAPMVKVLHDNFSIVQGMMTTTHAYTNDQRIADLVHKDLRRARAAAVNIIPTSTGAAKAIGSIIPELNGKLNGMSMRVPVPDGSVTDFVALCKGKVTEKAVNAAMKKAASSAKMKGKLVYCEDPIVSSDIIGNTASCIFDSLCTMVLGDNMVKVIGWYDNEWGYSNRVVDLMAKAASL
ncbi:MAG: type I glyceraldehyde-3-phosphate dehydrogenase [Planctomycetes bacterium]|nr:type I glyceraldehyde-3-phosphate dehydrogenase [Planctomycetota bacterium]